MRNKQHRNLSFKLIDRLGKASCSCFIETARRFIEYQNLRPLKQCACDRKALFLPARQPYPVLTYLSLIASGQFFDRGVYLCQLARLDYLLECCVWIRKRQEFS